MKYADDLLVAKEGTVLQGMIDKLIEIGRCYGMEMNVDKTKAMRILRQPSTVIIMIVQKQLENVLLNSASLRRHWERSLMMAM
jgi:ribosomal protein L39E